MYADKRGSGPTGSSFSRDATKFSWWKIKMYNYIIGVDDELWDIIEN
jgi:hypothetical protein